MSIYIWLVGFIAIVIAVLAGLADIRRRNQRSSRLAYEARGEFVDTCASAIESARIAIDRCKRVAESKPAGSAFAFLGEQLARMNADIAAAAISIERLRKAAAADVELDMALSGVVQILHDVRLQPMRHTTMAEAASILEQAINQLDENREIVRECHPARNPSERDQTMTPRNDSWAPTSVWR
jgi:hypothetical protein